MINFLKQIFVSILIFLGYADVFGTTSLSIDPTQRIKSKISKDTMNRITVTNDRITQVFGDNEAYEIQTEEGTGQVFIKPTPDNGVKPLSITIITENNITQDLLLEPIQKEASTLILKNQTPINMSGSSGVQAGTMMNSGLMNKALTSSTLTTSGYDFRTTSFQEQLVEAMKILVMGHGIAEEIESRPQRVMRNFLITFNKAYRLGDMKGVVFDVENPNDSTIEIKEEDFYQEGDLALSFESVVLKPHAVTKLYVVAR